MATQLKVPQLGMDMEEATIVRWLVAEGAEVHKGDPILEIDTDKTSFEIESPADGVIQGLKGEEGETIPVGALLAFIAAPGEEIPEAEVEKPDSSSDGGSGAKETVVGEVPEVRKPPVADTSRDGRAVRASPAARRAAAEHGLSIQEISGSGPHGRVYLSDVLQATIEQEAPQKIPQEIPPPPQEFRVAERAAPAASTRREPLSRPRRIGAERTARSFSGVPHFYLTRDLEVDRLLELLGRLKERMELSPSITELLVLAIARTLRDHPRLNARYAGDELELNSEVNVGIAVATDRGLVVPVIRNADTLPLRGIVSRSRDLVRKAREGKLQLDELSGGTFTLSNLGMMGVDSFDAIINAPEAAILAVGRTRTLPELQNGEWVPRRVISATLSIDHRVADGADGARFLMDLQAALTDWELLL